MRIRRKVIVAGALAFTALVLFALTDTSRFKDLFIFEEKREAENAPAVVTKIIDGDTLVAAGGSHVRLIGIDADEKGYPCFDAARRRLEELVLGKEVIFESDSEDIDQYKRKLRYVFLDGKNINEQLAAEGLAVARFYPENQKYKKEIVAAEAAAMEGKIGCKWSGQTQMEGTAKEGDKGGDYAWDGLAGETIDACAVQGYIGKEIITQGRVVHAYRSDSGAVFLDFGASYPNNCFTAVIFKSSQKNFMENPEDIYEGKMVRVKGEIEEYNGKPEVILKNPSQIEVGIEK